MLVDEDAMVRFFSTRIPEDIVSVRHFDRWWNQVRDEDPQRLDMTEDDLIAAEADDIDDAAFPPRWQYGDLTLALSYEFDPSSPRDGVTVTVPIGLLERIDPTQFQWNVPGLRDDLMAALIKSLPKRLRKRFVPAPETARRLGHS